MKRHTPPLNVSTRHRNQAFAMAADTTNDSKFEFRSLRPNELEQLFDHCGECFAPRTGTLQYRLFLSTTSQYPLTERSYFVSHFTMDPTRDEKNILIAYDRSTKQIASCVKIFIREIYVQGKATQAQRVSPLADWRIRTCVACWRHRRRIHQREISKARTCFSFVTGRFGRGRLG